MRLILIALCLVSLSSYGQWKSYILNPRGDTLNRVDMKGLKQGPWAIHVDELRGERGYEEEGYFSDDAKEGTWKKYSLEGVKIAEEVYRWGKLNGKQQYFTYNGGLIREESWRAMDPAIAFDTVDIVDMNDPTKVVDRVVVKNDGIAVMHGKWTYYDPVEGTILKTQHYVLGKLNNGVASNGIDGDDDLRPLDVTAGKTDSTGKKIVTKPQAVLDYEKKNSGKKKIKSRDGSTGQ